jgi:hypothetical protein
MKKIIIIILAITSFNASCQTALKLGGNLNAWTSIEIIKCDLFRFDPVIYCLNKKCNPNNLPRIVIKMDSYDCEDGFDEYRFYKDFDLAEQHWNRFNQGISFEQTIMNGKAKEYHIPLIKYMFGYNLKRA